jgi:hypothetical protein
LHAAAEQLDAVFVYAMGLGDVGAAVLIRDRASDDRLDTGEQESQYRRDCARHQTACNQTLFHAASSVTGEANQVACVVYELVHVRVTAK